MRATRIRWLVVMLGLVDFLAAQDLAPRAYLITPVRSNAVIVTWAFYDGGLNLVGNIPITTSGRYNIPVFSYYHSLDFFGRSANFSVSLPYGFGNFEANGFGQTRRAYRSGLFDLGGRFSVNLKGGPAMAPEQFAHWKQGTIIGASLRVIAPSGQYSSKQLLNWGMNRWAFKPELGFSQRWGNWVLDGYGGVWLYTKNSADFDIPLPAPQTQEPIGSFEGHLSRDFSRGTWISLDGNFWWGGVTTLDGIRKPNTRQTSSRLGATAAFRVSKHQSIKASYSGGTYVRFGGNFQSVSFAWQYSWLRWP